MAILKTLENRPVSKKIRVAIVMGGPSAEHEVSLRSGDMVARFLDKKKYAAKKIIISKSGKWPLEIKTLKEKFDIVFNALHGEYGEDGTLQKILERERIPFTGSKAVASKLGMDKVKSVKLFSENGLLVPPYCVIVGFPNAIIPPSCLGFPAVIKPADRGSSVGMSIIEGLPELKDALKKCFAVSNVGIIQSYIKGTELTCGVLEVNGKPKALPPTEIVPVARKFFDYHAKYTPGATEEITPARISKALTKKVMLSALKAHKCIGASGYSRSDFILGEDGKLYILEINTLPGLTKQSLLPQAAQSAGITFPQLLDYIIESAMK